MGSVFGVGGGVEFCCIGGFLLWFLVGGVGSGLVLVFIKVFLLVWLSINDLIGVNRFLLDCVILLVFLIMLSIVLKLEMVLWVIWWNLFLCGGELVFIGLVLVVCLGFWLLLFFVLGLFLFFLLVGFCGGVIGNGFYWNIVLFRVKLVVVCCKGGVVWCVWGKLLLCGGLGGVVVGVWIFILGGVGGVWGVGLCFRKCCFICLICWLKWLSSLWKWLCLWVGGLFFIGGLAGGFCGVVLLVVLFLGLEEMVVFVVGVVLGCVFCLIVELGVCGNVFLGGGMVLNFSGFYFLLIKSVVFYWKREL